MSLRRWFLHAALLLVAAGLAMPAFAQDTGMLEGRVRDDKGNPVKEATVTAKAGRGPVATITDAEGRYTLANLPPGTYQVRAEAEGMGAIVQERVQVSINSRQRLDFSLQPGKKEEITVTAEPPVIDPKSTTIGGTFTVNDYKDFVPIGRNFSDSFTFAPGVTGGGGTGAGNYSISGASGLENSYIVDGVNITNTGYGGIGSYNIVYGSLGSGVTYDFLEEIQVKTGGIDAEYGQATGGVINTVVKSGTNDFSGQVSVFLSPGSGEAEWQDVHRSIGAINTEETETTDLAGSVGGAIVKDKLFYFAAYNPVETQRKISIEPIEFNPLFNTPPTPATANSTYPAGFTTFPAAAGNQERTRTSDNWAAKLTWNVAPNHRLEFSGFGDPSDGDQGPQLDASLRNLQFPEGGGQSRISYGANNYSLKYDAVFTPNFFMTVQASRHDGKFRDNSTLDFTRVSDRRQELAFLFPQLYSPTGERPDNAAIWRTGGTGFLSNSNDKSDQYKLIATWVNGNHEIKGGLQYDDVKYTDDQSYSGAPVGFVIPLDVDGGGFSSSAPCPDPVESAVADCAVTVFSTSGTLIDARPTVGGASTQWRSTRARFYPTPPPTTTKDTNLFATWTWSVTPRVNLKLGARATQQKIEGSGGFTLPFDANRSPGTTPFNAGNYKFDWEVAPRLGVTWDATGDGRTKLYASANRYVERIPNDLAVRSLSNEVGISRYTWTDFDYSTGTPLSPAALTNPASTIFFQGLATTRIEDGTKIPYVDEYLIGFQKELGRDLSVEVRAIYREQGRALEDVQYTSIESIQNYYYGINAGYPSDPFPGFAPAPFGEYVLANPGDNTQVGTSGVSIPKAKHTYKALEFVASKRFSNHWLLYGNFRVSKLRGNYEGLYRNDNGQSDPNITSLFDFPLSPLTAAQFQEGPLNTDRPYVAKIWGSYTWDNGLTLGGAFNWEAGTPRTPLLAHPIYINSGELPGVNPTYGWWSTFNEAAPSACDAELFLKTGSANDFGSDPCFSTAIPFLVDYEAAKRGSMGRTPDLATFDLHASWKHAFGKSGTLGLALTVFNVFDFREPTLFDDAVEATAGTPNVDFGRVTQYQQPRLVRVMARWGW